MIRERDATLIDLTPQWAVCEGWCRGRFALSAMLYARCAILALRLSIFSLSVVLLSVVRSAGLAGYSALVTQY